MFNQLLAGDDQVQIKSLALTSPGRRVVVDDEESTKYLSEAFRSATRDRPPGGLSYNGYVYLSTGGYVQCAIYVHTEQPIFSVSEPNAYYSVNEPMFYYVVTLPEPIPERLVQTLAELRRPRRPLP
jgi:hypothetical protein